MPPFRSGTTVSYPKGKKRKDGTERTQKYLRVTAGPQRGQYVHDLITEARLGRKLEKDETVEHKDGNGLNIDPESLIVVTRSFNSRLRVIRERKARAREAGQEEIPWANQL